MKEIEQNDNKITIKRISILIISIGIFILLPDILPSVLQVPSEQAVGIAILLGIALLWLSEAIHISITALLVPVLAILYGVFDTTTALSSFANPIIFLFLGGFVLAAALSLHNIDQWLAERILLLAKGHLILAILLIFLTTALLSMWISNTATAAIMIPLTLGILKKIHQSQSQSIMVFALLGVAYCASIGGIATIIGSPPNAIAVAEHDISFIQWFSFSAPLSLLLFFVVIAVLWWLFRPEINSRFSDESALDHTQQSLSGNQYKTLIIFGIVVCSWILSGWINQIIGPISKLDSVISVTGIIVLVITGCINWEEIQKRVDWGVLILFGGGLCLSGVLKTTGTSTYLAQALTDVFSTTPIFISILLLLGFVILLTEFASNTASAALLVPIFSIVAPSLHLSPVVLGSLVAIAASCAFMLPVATPPNAIAYATGQIRQTLMMKTGMYLNIICMLVITLYGYVLSHHL